MTKTMSITIAQPYQVLPLADLVESPLNPRKHFDQAKLEELAASIRAHGILTPLLVRPNPHANKKGYEIAAGHRRYRAALLATHGTAPCIVRDLDDQAFLEILVIENDQREDVHPLEEAAGYQALLQLKGYDVQRIADRIGRSAKYVYDRVKLLQLTKKLQQIFLENRITAGHAILLARLSAKDQDRVLAEALFEDEQLLFHPEDKRGLDGEKPISVRELQAWIDAHVKFDAKNIDSMLFPETAETVASIHAEGEKLVAITHEIMTPDEVRNGPRPVLGRSWKRADGTKGSKTCEHSHMGFIEIGPGRGETFLVCTAKKKCLVHWKDSASRAQQLEHATASGIPAAIERAKKAQLAADAKERAAQEKDAADRERFKRAIPAILQAVAERVKTMPVKGDGFLAQMILKEMNVHVPGRDAQLVPRGSSAEDLIRHLAFLALAEKVTNDWWGPREFPKLAKSIGLDVQKILDQAAPVEKPKASKPAKGKQVA